jgi:general secretion pathway protein D
MKRLFLCGYFLSALAFAAPGPQVDAPRFDFRSVTVSAVIGLLYADALKTPYVIDPVVLKDERLVSFRFDSSKGDIRVFWRSFLDSLGYVVTQRGGADFISEKKKDDVADADEQLFVYRPMHRPVSYLVDLLQAGFKPGSFGVQRSIKPGSPGEKVPTDAPSGSAAASINVDSDVVMFHGSAKDVQRFRSILPMVDSPVGEVVVKAIVYEVTTGRSDASAFALAVSVLGGRLGVSVGASEALSNALTIKTGSVQAALSALQGDSRFKAVSTPTLRVKSGQRAQLMVGQDVPTLSSVSYPQGSAVPVQSVEYRSSGVILSLSPLVRQASIDVQVDQQISDFARTESGVNNSPTLTKRSLSTTVGMMDGDLIVLGGLTQDRDSSSNSGHSFLPKFMRSASSSDSRTEVLLLLQVSRVGI